jgi:hypothetical protein
MSGQSAMPERIPIFQVDRSSRRGGSIIGSNAMARKGTVWDDTRVEAQDYSAYSDCAGWYGTKRRDLQHRRLKVRF